MGVSGPPSEDAHHLPDALAAASPLLRKIQISNSKLTGTLPRTYGSWQRMMFMSFESNGLTGGIPQVILLNDSPTDIGISNDKSVSGSVHKVHTSCFCMCLQSSRPGKTYFSC
jgi:hypothetical protein